MFHYTKNVSLYRSDINSYSIEPSAPPAPWYYYRYPMAVIAKAHIVLEKTWYDLPVEWQTYYLELYLCRYNNNNNNNLE